MGATFRRWFGPYAHARVWKESVHLLADLPMGIVLFTMVVTMLSLSAGMMVTLVGLPLLVGTVIGGRQIGVVERARVRVLLDTQMPGDAPIRWQGGTWQRAKQALGDKPGWKGLVYGLVMLPWGVVSFTVAVVVWSVALSGALFPIYCWWIPGTIDGKADGAFSFGDHYVLHGWGRFGYGAGVTVVGLLFLALLPRIVHAFASAHRALVQALLSPSPSAALEQRVSELEVSREASVESSAGELRRIERDLHDGAQQRLVSLAMNLGMAKERLRDSDDERAREMVDAAHVEAKQAIAELRDLVRGIHPAVLTDRGLDAAVSALVARCPVPVALHTDLPRRLPSAIEATAYFVVAEALTNVAKHSQARSAMVRLVEHDGRLLVEVHDDGIGGADDAAGGGLRGLRDRVAGVEGRLRIASPAGGPTVVSVDLPCGS